MSDSQKKLQSLVELIQSKAGSTLSIAEGKLEGCDTVKLGKVLMDNEVDLESFRSIDLKKNELDEVPVVLYRLKNLIELDASYNQIKMLQNMCRWNDLTVLDLSHNNLKVMPKLLLSNSPLKKLDISNNQLRSFPHLPRSIEELNASSNKIDQLPQDFIDFSNLTDLNIANNHFSSLKGFSGACEENFTKLTTINASNNKLTSLPSVLSVFVSLTSVMANGNLFEAKELEQASNGSSDLVLKLLKESWEADAPLREEKARIAAQPTGIWAGIAASLSSPGINPGVIKAGYAIFALLMVLDISLLVAMGPNIHVFIMFFLSFGLFGGLQLYLFELEEDMGGYKQQPKSKAKAKAE